MKLLLVFILMSVLFVGCAGSLSLTPSSKQQYKNYQLNVSQKVSIGDPIIEVENANVKDAYVVLFDYQTPTLGLFGSQQMFLNKGDRFTAVAFIPSDLNAVLVREEGPEKKSIFIHIYPNGKINRGWCLADGTVPVQGSWTKEQLFVKSDNPSRTENSFRAQIIYSGITGNTVKAVYREFSNDYARPAFTQELQYSLDESNVISYKSIKIKIIKATNSEIEFTVVDDGGLPWLSK
ncbi:MAG: hypothetical protein KJ666_06335 [Bacteroidetes bacterium]|nr:hypothetical protein [Bacteroidota bacterium]